MSAMSKPKIKIISQEKRRASVTMLLRMGNLEVVQPKPEPTAAQAGQAQTGTVEQLAGKNDNLNFEAPASVVPSDADFIYPRFRAVSQTLVEDYWLDWSRAGVLEAAVPLLAGQTVYKNHSRWDVETWLGAVSKSEWDAAGANSGGVPGISVELKIDAALNPRIARGLMMKPPAIHSVSVTAVFEFEYSHPDIAAESKYKFFELLGHEVDGSIVRIIVTRVVEFLEISLVTMGADRLAKQLPGDDEEDDGDNADFEEMIAARDEQPPIHANKEEKKTVKLTTEQKKAFGVEFDGEDVPDDVVATAMQTLASKASQANTLVESMRSDVRRAATLAELGAEEGALPEIIGDDINQANAERLVKLKAYYEQKAAERFPKNGRSSAENSTPIEQAGGVQKPQISTVGLH